MTTAIYTRISSTDTELGVSRQLDDCIALAKLRGLTDAVEYRDNDASATSGKVRERYQAMLAAMRAGKIKTVIAWHTDRLYRLDGDRVEFVKVARAKHVKIITVMGGEIDLANASGRLVAGVLGVTSAFEVERVQERLLAEKRQKALSGEWTGGRRPFGWDMINGELVINEPQAAAIRTAIDSILAGVSHRQVVAQLNAVRETPIRLSSLRPLVTKPSLAGLAVHQGVVVGQGNWPAIIDEATHLKLVAHFEQRKLGGGRKVRKHLGTSLYTCATCGQRVTTTGGSHDKRARYVCQDAHLARIAPYVDEYVRRVTRALLAQQPTILAALANADAVDLGPLLSERAELIDQQAELVALRLAKVITVEALTKGSQAAQARVAELDELIARASAVEGSAAAAVFAAADPVAAFDAADVERQRAVVATLLRVELGRASKNRPAGWTFGERYFDRSSVKLTNALTGQPLDAEVVAA